MSHTLFRDMNHIESNKNFASADVLSNKLLDTIRKNKIIPIV